MPVALAKQSSELSLLWEEWLSILELFAESHPKRLDVNSDEYSHLHQRLLDACKTVRTEANSDTALAIESLVAPWMTLTSLKDADAKLLKSVVNQCRELDGRGIHSAAEARRRSSAQIFVFLGVFLVIFAAAFVALSWDTLRSSVLESDSVRMALRSWWKTVEANRGSSRTWMLGTLAALFTTATAYIVFRAPRAY